MNETSAVYDGVKYNNFNHLSNADEHKINDVPEFSEVFNKMVFANHSECDIRMANSGKVGIPFSNVQPPTTVKLWRAGWQSHPNDTYLSVLDSVCSLVRNVLWACLT